jgi:hypothetical protein
VYSVSQLPFRRPLSNKFLHDLQLLVATGFESARVVKYVAIVIGEHKFILDVVLAALSKARSKDRDSGIAEAQYERH